MTRAERELRELSLTLFATGRFESRAAARRAALEQLEREREKREEYIAFHPPPIPITGTYLPTIGPVYTMLRR